MIDIPVYKSEKEIAGLADKIKASARISYASKLEKYTPSKDDKYVIYNKELSEKFGKKVSAAEHDSDLYTVKSVLVSTTWNLNDDVFEKGEVWVARHTPEDKPTNLNHEEAVIVGHITGNWAVDNDGKNIPDDSTIDELPDVFHILTSAVIYRGAWTDQALIDRTNKLIAEIEAGEKFVSMECLLRDFDYALKSPDGSNKIIARNSDTAFLTKHLKFYGGTGEYNGMKIGRLVRNITFCGKGYVDKPANPNSIILNSSENLGFSKASRIEKNDIFFKAGVIVNMGEPNMQDNELLQKEIVELKKSLAEANEKLASGDKEKFVSQISDLTSKLEKAEKSNIEYAAEIKNMAAELETANKTKTELETKNKALSDEINAVKLNELKSSRIATLVEAGFDKETAKTKIEKFMSLNDEMFKDVAEALVASVKKVEEPAKVDDVKVDDVIVDTKVEAGEKKVEPTLSAETEKTNQLAELRTQLAEKIASKLKTSKKTKKE